MMVDIKPAAAPRRSPTGRRSGIDEDLPGVTSESVRLPRRLPGGEPQHLVVLLLADFTLQARAWLPSAAIVALLGEYDIKPANARAALSRLTRRGALERDQQGRRTAYRLSPSCALHLAYGARQIATYGADAESWDGAWTIVMYSVPHAHHADREALRSELRWLGLAPLYDGVWLSPSPLPDHATDIFAGIGSATVTAFRARRTELPHNAGRDPLGAWNLAEIAERYQGFVQYWNGYRQRMRSQVPTGAEALHARVRILDEYRLFTLVDPPLPTRLMPPGWPREHATELFSAIYDSLGRSAYQHLVEIVSDHTDTPSPGITCHTVADMASGLWPTEADRR